MPGDNIESADPSKSAVNRVWSQHGPFWGGVRLALLALSFILRFAQTVGDNANNTSLTPLAQQL